MTMFLGKISKRGYGPRIIENKLPDGYVRINDKLYKVNADGTKTEIEMKGPFSLEEFLKLNE